jgi:hypothetical protein
MSKNSVIQREKNRVGLRAKYYLLRKYLKGKILTTKSFQGKLFYQSQLDMLPRDSSYSKYF